MRITFATYLTFLRIITIPIILGAYLIGIYWDYQWSFWLSFIIYTLSCITDFFDGWLARTQNQISALGRILDPIADKMLVACVILILIGGDIITGLHICAVAIIIMREIAVSGLREFLAEIRIGMPVSQLAKWKTAAQMGALGFLLLVPTEIIPFLHEIGLSLLWLAAVMTAITGFDYLILGMRHIKDN